MEGFKTFMASLKNQSFRSNENGCGVDLVLSCVDNYEARMVVNQVINKAGAYFCSCMFALLGSGVFTDCRYVLYLFQINVCIRNHCLHTLTL